jgi:hypothetical protein
MRDAPLAPPFGGTTMTTFTHNFHRVSHTRRKNYNSFANWRRRVEEFILLQQGHCVPLNTPELRAAYTAQESAEATAQAILAGETLSEGIF